MSYHRILTIQDISCVGQCSMTVAMPILSACGQETCVLPSAVLSTHTGGFADVVFRDLSHSMPEIWKHWQKEGISFDAIYTGYLGSVSQIETVKEILGNLKNASGVAVVDPAMADHGKLYRGFDEAYVMAMKQLCACADILIPNLTEACMLTGHPYKDTFDEVEIKTLLKELVMLGCKYVILTGVGYEPEETGVVVFQNGKLTRYPHRKIPGSYHGTGDIFAAAFVGSYLRGKDLEAAARIAADFTALCIENTYQNPAHWYGVRFEPVLPKLIDMLK